jgi:DNA-3-methyladenine glycosylase
VDHARGLPRALRLIAIGRSASAGISGSSQDLARLVGGAAVEAARGLLGALLIRDDGHRARIGRIVEVEAYVGPEDRASHARAGRTVRNASMFGPAGRTYVYGVYGMHTCLNIVCGPEGAPSAVLVRAVEPIAGADAMRDARLARGMATRRAARAAPALAATRFANLPVARLASGPGNVGAAFSIAREDDGRDLLDPAGPLRLEPRPPGAPVPEPASGPRVGVGFAGAEWAARPWRFWIPGSAALSGPRGR